MENKEHHIHIVDSPVGSGKTTAAIDKINKLENGNRVIFITPFKSEIERVIRECPNKNIKQPNVRHGGGRKGTSFLKLIKKNYNIASTHSLFMNINDETIAELKAKNYMLILDEAFDVVQQYDLWQELKYATINKKKELTKENIKSLINKKFISVDDDFMVRWIDNENQLYKYNFFKNLIDRKLIYLINKCFLLWIFPPEVFSKDIFHEIFILTFQFEYQIQYYYYKYFGIEYDKMHVVDDGWGNYKIVETKNNDHEIEWIKKIAPLIKIEEGSKFNAIGSFERQRNRSIGYFYEGALSKNWYNTHPNGMIRVRNNVIRYFVKTSDKKGFTVPSDLMWTCFKEHMGTLKSGRTSIKNWVALNARATNVHRNKSILAYPVNRYANPFIKQFFSKKGVDIEEDRLALSELIQWMFRSRVRDGKSIDIYIPSQRMRNLLKDYLKGENTNESEN